MKNSRQQSLLKSASGAVLVAFCGLLLWKTPLGEAWVNASYDYSFRFATRPAGGHHVTLILMDNEAFGRFHQTRGQPWDRALHARLLNRLADDGCAMVVMDAFFRELHDPAQDEALADAMRRQRHMVLMAEQSQLTDPSVTGVRAQFPAEKFLAAATNWGVAWLNPDQDLIVRRHWPFPSSASYPSLPWTAARLAGAHLEENPRERWLRYYNQPASWTRMSYTFALTKPANYFRDQIVFIGSQPATSLAGDEPDEFRTPFWRWTDEATGGVDIMIAEFLNLLNGDALHRPVWWLEMLVLTTIGLLLGWIFSRVRPGTMFILTLGFMFAAALAGILLGYFTNYWFPWLVVMGGQVPCAVACGLIFKISRPRPSVRNEAETLLAEPLPLAPGYELIDPPFGEGAYGKVWLARDTHARWVALKTVYRKKFEHPEPYEREFNGVNKYQPLSDQHPGLLRLEFVSEKLDGYFYYVMELGDALQPGWQNAPADYRPRDLVSERAHLPGRRLPVRDCAAIGLELADALDFLHCHGLTHRDIKPQNIIFVGGRPKLADLGLITDIRPQDEVKTYVGTPGYMPPECPGTPQADIYALGMVLYVLSTGRNPALFPEISTTLVGNQEPGQFILLNTIILKACQPDPAHRYASASEMRHALQQALALLG
jgi:CHASE2 domain-containing sensor protein